MKSYISCFKAGLQIREEVFDNTMRATYFYSQIHNTSVTLDFSC